MKKLTAEQLTTDQLLKVAKDLIEKYNETLNDVYSDQYNKVMLLINLRLENGQL